jgi:UDP-N-acetyl-D-glucosamine/UDP-N-acetyl-D-galactosamine dehydrogenase
VRPGRFRDLAIKMGSVLTTVPRKIAIIGLGYVGLPITVALARHHAHVVGFDVNAARIAELKAGFDKTLEVQPDDLQRSTAVFADDPAHLKDCDFFIVTVPTPITGAKQPDMSALAAASRTVGGFLKRGDIVVYESTVYPGATEDFCAPILEEHSGLACGRDFFLGYSPERINPGDAGRRFEDIVKVVSGQTPAVTDIVAAVYGSVVKAGLYRAQSIKVAEAAKVIENTQRDLNIALINELSRIFSKLGLDTHDVLAAARTKWNFLNFTPGLVGGHCIGIDPYYLLDCAERAGYSPQIIVAGRRVNDAVGAWIAREAVKRLVAKGRTGNVTILGLSFKEGVGDIRNTKVIDIVRELSAYGIAVQVADPLADPEECRHEYGLELTPFGALAPADAVILAVAHPAYRELGWPDIAALLKPGASLVMDVKAVLDRSTRPDGIDLWRM